LVSLGSLAANFVVSATLIGVAIIPIVVQEPLSLPHEVIIVGSRSRGSDRRKRNRYQERGRQSGCESHFCDPFSNGHTAWNAGGWSRFNTDSQPGGVLFLPDLARFVSHDGATQSPSASL
jgi:hypothetical protein